MSKLNKLSAFKCPNVHVTTGLTLNLNACQYYHLKPYVDLNVSYNTVTQMLS